MLGRIRLTERKWNRWLPDNSKLNEMDEVLRTSLESVVRERGPSPRRQCVHATGVAAAYSAKLNSPQGQQGYSDGKLEGSTVAGQRMMMGSGDDTVPIGQQSQPVATTAVPGYEFVINRRPVRELVVQRQPNGEMTHCPDCQGTVEDQWKTWKDSEKYQEWRQVRTKNVTTKVVGE